MKLKKFKIKNYKSIVDSGDCYLTDTITILAGKNESGKTSILEALQDFDTDEKIRESAKPIKSPEAVPEISITFVVEKETLKEILEEIKSPVKATADVEFEIIKTFPDKYTFGETTLQSEIFGGKEIEKIQKSIKDKWEKIKLIRGKYEALAGNLFDFEFSNFENDKTLFTNFTSATTPNVTQITDEKERERFSKLLDEIQTDINNLANLLAAETKFLETLKQWIPNFILFNSFEDIFPNKIPFAELEKNEWIKDLSVISDLKIATIKGTDDRGKEKHKDDVNIKLNKDYEKFWTQDVSNLSVNWDSEHLYFWVKEDRYPYEPSLRSKGRQWHLAFYIKVSARASENTPNIILIDEPGLFLHAKAQEDILGKLEDSAKEVQLIFSTHSPYLLEADKLNRIRLIHRTNTEGTRIENKVHALADKETLTPILTAIGLELNAGISALDKKNNVIVEGPSDVFYLNAFKKTLNKNSVNFIFGGGCGNMPFVGTILHGWGGKVIYLYDNDQGKKDGEKNLKDNWLVSKDLILSVLGTAGSIEDIFSPSDFKQFVLNDVDKTYTGTNAEYVKKAKLDKVLLAKKFLETCQNGTSISLDKTTMDNINKLIENIEGKF
ncbi:MAG: AAA family ATPase [Candidatus Sungbacteria bacterium]|uniref:AAA family ATPase n=1 Tax=Candidatus Sungiibacteriota bacterium TaxID=2750080 RepID=A0A9D6LTR8_9BACT|nr:AAA family ATPase [Candidatus Sungbacteria bacterium]